MPRPIRSANTSEIVFPTSATTTAGQRAIQQGKARRIARGILTTNIRDPLEQVVRRNWPEIVAHHFPGATVVDRSFFSGGPDAEGRVTLDVGPGGPARSRPLELPGLTMITRIGPGPVDGDVPHLDGLFFSGQARAFLDNLRPSRARLGFRRTLTRSELEAQLARLYGRGGEEGLNHLRDAARQLSEPLGVVPEMKILNDLIGGLLGTREVPLSSDAAIAVRSGTPFDQARLALFTALQQELLSVAPVVRAVRKGDDRTVLAFYEAYFSNYIEGTRFTVEEASDIVFHSVVPDRRPADAHDIRGTFRLIHPPEADTRVPASADELFDLLEQRHRMLLGQRPDTHPGQFKDRNNQAGATTFVDWRLVRGTLREGFRFYAALPDGFARAVFIMFLIAEVHPFTDGNGRIARIFMNAELTATNQQRIIVPTGYRQNYLSALSGLSHNTLADAVVRMMDFAHRYTVSIDWSSQDRAQSTLDTTGAFEEGPMTVLRLPQPWD